jgi:DNA-binding FadR family transcriptional regulator
MEAALSVALPRKLARAPLHMSVQQSLKQYVTENGLKGGDRLPAEATLAGALGVARNSVREAVKALESVGILEVRRGVGVFVRDFSLAPLLDHLSFGLDLRDVAGILQVRRTLETGLLARAVAAIGTDDLEALARTVQSMETLAARGETFAAEDRAFHTQLFRCLNNRVLVRLIDVFWIAFDKASGFFDKPGSDPMAAWRDHADILAAIVAGDADAACAVLERHYSDIAGLIARQARTADMKENDR